MFLCTGPSNVSKKQKNNQIRKYHKITNSMAKYMRSNNSLSIVLLIFSKNRNCKKSYYQSILSI